MPSRRHILILAAGRGTRMGGPKALMNIDGRPWWMHQRDRLEELDYPVTWIVSAHVHEEMLATARPSAAPRTVLSDPDHPMFASILAGLESLRADRPDGIFILPVDCPAPAPHIWKTLADSPEVSFPTHRTKNGHPVYLPWPFVTGTLFPATKAADPATLRLDLLIAPVARSMPVDDPTVAINLNTPKDAREWIDATARKGDRSLLPE